MCVCRSDLYHFRSCFAGVVAHTALFARASASAMAGFHAVTLFVPKPLQQALVQLFFSLLTAHPEHYEPVIQDNSPEGWASYDSIMFMSCNHQDRMVVYLCRGQHFQMLTSHPAGRYHYYLGYMSNYSILRVFNSVFEMGHYVEVLSFKEHHYPNRNTSDLYVRVPSLSTDHYVVLWSAHLHTDVYLNSYRTLDYDRMHRMGYRSPGMKGMMYPVLQIHPLSSEAEHSRIGHLKDILPEHLYDEMFTWASYYNETVYKLDLAEGVPIMYPSDEETAILVAINGALHGILQPAVYADLARVAQYGPASLLPTR